jgi:4-hydroxy-tetrahydrodipicolinate reductase
MIDVAVAGANGRMGSKIIKTIQNQEDMRVVIGVEAPNSPLEGKDVGEVIGIGKIGAEVWGAQKLEEVLKNEKPDVLVDFTIAVAAVDNIKTAAKCGVNVVVGTTGFSDTEMAEIKKTISENKIKAIIAPNMAVGVNVFFKVIEDLASILNDYNVEIIETHHKHKRDAPSGTARKAFEIIAGKVGRETDEICVHGREGMVGERTAEEIGIHAVRAGDIVGEHTVLFAGDGERLEIIHRAHSRQAFVSGVIKAIRYIKSADEGKINDMGDVLGLK